jgi:hypothetical protein
MSVSCGTRHVTSRHGERGEGRLKFLIVIAILGVIAYSGYQYVPVAIQAYQFKDVMQQTVNTAAIQSGTTRESLKKLITERAQEYGAPPATQVEVTQQDGRWQARVQYTRHVPLPFYTYDYIFDHMVKSFDPATLR